MSHSSLRIPKQQVPMTIWVHPEGRVAGAIFLNLPGPDSHGTEQPWDVLNESADFLVIKRSDPEGVRFYNKSSIVRVEYRDDARFAAEDGKPLPCRVIMMDGALIEGEFCKALPEEQSRLSDYVRDTRERFFKLRLAGGDMTLVNKSYVVYISELEGRPRAVQPGEAGSAAGDPLGLAV